MRVVSIAIPAICVHLWFHNKGDQMSENEYLLKDETHQIIGCSMEVINEVGHGFHEKIYENALVVEFQFRNIPFIQQPEYQVTYKQTTVGTYIPDLICFDSVVVDTKTIERIGDHEIGKMLNYLKVTGLRVGLLINFKNAKLEWKRVVR
jgi:GxxExxY protein